MRTWSPSEEQRERLRAEIAAAFLEEGEAGGSEMDVTVTVDRGSLPEELRKLVAAFARRERLLVPYVGPATPEQAPLLAAWFEETMARLWAEPERSLPEIQQRLPHFTEDHFSTFLGNLYRFYIIPGSLGERCICRLRDMPARRCPECGRGPMGLFPEAKSECGTCNGFGAWDSPKVQAALVIPCKLALGDRAWYLACKLVDGVISGGGLIDDGSIL